MIPPSLKERVNAIEECYEFMLAYAAQGLPGDAGSSSGSHRPLSAMFLAVDGL